ncbi:glucosaminidase domain-containing protein [Enterococcus devriesei]|uniref:glucosaminidase domain-containing protein n=1 Tax=Enterococcus devriesei TaxID=319970 RepID=UPI001FEB4BD6|nr:glucosaminidase domain-containing protein [Enterococcus devriesei]
MKYNKILSLLAIGTMVGPTLLSSQQVLAEESSTVPTSSSQEATESSSTGSSSSESQPTPPTPKPEIPVEPETPTEPVEPVEPVEPETPTEPVKSLITVNDQKIVGDSYKDSKGNIISFKNLSESMAKEKTVVQYSISLADAGKFVLKGISSDDVTIIPETEFTGHFTMPANNVSIQFIVEEKKQESKPDPAPAPKPEPNNKPAGNTNNGNTQKPAGNTATPKQDQAAARQPESAPADVRVPSNQKAPTYSNDVQNAIVQEAYRYLGMPYVWGAKGPNAFDCSGLAYVVYANATGHYIGGWTGDQQYAGTQIPVSEAQPGDLLFWGAPTSVTTHVAIYIGNGQYIHAPQPGDVVKIGNISDFAPTFAVRVNMAGLPKASSSLSNAFGEYSTNQPFVFNKNQTTDQFIKKIGETSREIGQKNGIYSSVMIAQAILESGSGNSSLASEPNYNLFGIKGKFKDQGVTFNTLEQDKDGKSYQISSEFRKYPSYKESLEDYANLLKKGITGNADFYKDTWKDQTESYQDATKHLQGRYATDKQYAEKLNAIIKAYDLTQFDQAKESKEVKKITTGPEIKATKMTFDFNERLQNKLLASIANNKRIPQAMTTKHFINLFRGDSLIALASTAIPAKKVVTETLPTAASMYITLSSGLLAILPPLR